MFIFKNWDVSYNCWIRKYCDSFCWAELFFLSLWCLRSCMTSTVHCLPLMKCGNMVMSYRFPAIPRHQSNFGGRWRSPVSHDSVIAVLIGVKNQCLAFHLYSFHLVSAFRQKTICSVWNNFVFDFMLKEFLLDLANRHNIDRMLKFSAEWLISSFGGLWIISVSIDFSPLPTFITFKFRKMVGNQNGFHVREAFRIAGFPRETCFLT